ncbi:hypothetical protein [Carnobacterium maltaromaticum]|uniref:hypothetical protein n=1 Tax=Carnobacterium maltaromaticum TaxID=2751 RepID=UPI00295E6E1C|nr:hypothetical protein [Carnobacterium maltaromaticum]
MTKLFKLVGIETHKVYFESTERSELQRWLDDEFGSTETGVRKNIAVQPMPEAMRIVYKVK